VSVCDGGERTTSPAYLVEHAGERERHVLYAHQPDEGLQANQKWRPEISMITD
jgi:hypothetical protein